MVQPTDRQSLLWLWTYFGANKTSLWISNLGGDDDDDGKDLDDDNVEKAKNKIVSVS